MSSGTSKLFLQAYTSYCSLIRMPKRHECQPKQPFMHGCIKLQVILKGFKQTIKALWFQKGSAGETMDCGAEVRSLAVVWFFSQHIQTYQAVNQLKLCMPTTRHSINNSCNQCKQTIKVLPYVTFKLLCAFGITRHACAVSIQETIKDQVQACIGDQVQAYICRRISEKKLGKHMAK